MKMMLITWLFAAFAATPAPAAPVTADDDIIAIGRAIGSGDVAALLTHVDGELELSILDEEDVYTKAAAGTRLKAFFEKFSPTGFNQVHQGSSKADDAEYVIGNLVTAKGSFRVYIYVAKKNGKVVLQELRFDRE